MKKNAKVPLDKEPAEGSRETVDKALRRARTPSGISNRPLGEEQAEQASLPPRGRRRRRKAA
jgi:hypothetical protein